MTTGSSLSTGRAAYMSGSNVVGVNTLTFGNSVSWTFRSAVRSVGTSDAIDNFISRVGFIDKADLEPNDGCYFRYNHATNGGRWQGVCRNNDVETVCDTGITYAVNTWRTMQIGVAADASVASFVTSGVQRCTVASNIPTLTTRSTGFGASVIKGGGTTASGDLDLDFIDIRGTGTGLAGRE